MLLGALYWLPPPSVSVRLTRTLLKWSVARSARGWYRSSSSRLLPLLPGQRGAVAPRGHRLGSRQPPASARSPPYHSELVADELAAAAIQDRRPPDLACSVLHPPAGRKPLDAAPLWADPRAYPAARSIRADSRVLHREP